MSHTDSNLLSHVVFSTKDRRPLRRGRETATSWLHHTALSTKGGKVLSLNSEPDHLYRLWQLPPTASLADSMRLLKTNSSRWVHETWGARKPFGWQTGYGVFSVSRSNVSAFARYIEEQESHHRKRTIQEEFVELLVKHH